MKRTPILAALTALALCGAPAWGQEVPASPDLDARVVLDLPEGTIRVHFPTLLQGWAKATGRRATWSDQVAQVQINTGGLSFDRGEILALAARHGLQVIEGPGEVFGCSLREAASMLQPSTAPLYEQDASLPRTNTYISLSYRVRYGAGSAIYANLRGILARDPGRTGNILYVQGPERLIITDFAPSVEAYRQLLRSLDQPLSGQLVTLYQVPGARWEVLKQQPSAAICAALAKDLEAGQVVRLEEVRSAGEDLRFKRALQEGPEATMLKFELVNSDSSLRGSASRIKISLTRVASETQSEAELEFTANRSGPDCVTAVRIDGSKDRAQLVVVVTPLR